ncbi:MAG: hypothetical protein ACJ8J0_08535, partial [Longimicrobiaceae bacterium]
RVILCTAEPGWVQAVRQVRKPGASSGPEVGKQGGFDNLEFFERHIIRENGLVLAATLTGDTHHYTRYSYLDADGKESVAKITAGGGGAHGHPTHHLPDRLPLAFAPVEDGGEAAIVHLDRHATFPTKEESRRLVNGIWRLGKHNPGMACLLAILYALMFLCFHGAFVGWCGQRAGFGPCPAVGPSASPYLGPLIGMLAGNGVLLALFVAGALCAVASLFPVAAPWMRKTAGLLHAAAHVGLVVAAAVLLVKPTAMLASRFGLDPVVPVVVFAVAMLLAGWFVGTVLMALYFWIAEKVGVNESEVLAAQAIDRYKNFLRLHVTEKELTVYPFGIRKVVPRNDWEINRDGAPGTPLVKPKAGRTPRIHLIEEPIVIPRDVRPPYPSAER